MNLTESHPLDRHQVADLLVKLKPTILQQWEKQSRKQVAAAMEQSLVGLRDALPEFLNQLVKTLRGSDPAAQADTNSEVAHEHAEDRANQPEYNLNAVLFEYHILRAVIIENVESAGSIDWISQKVIHEFIDQGISKTAVRYSELEMARRAAQVKETEGAKLEALTKSTFLANMSHEIRTPLGAIMGFIDLLKDADLSKAEVANYVSIIDRNSRHLMHIIDDILDLTKVEAGKMLVEKTKFSLMEFIADFSLITEMKAKETNLIFEFLADSSLPEFVISDPTRLRQILFNVVGNAIKFTEKGRVVLLIKYDEEYLYFRVSDTGRGISKEQGKFLFQAFTQADSSTTRKFGGTGLGLVLTKKLSVALGGDFTLIKSSPSEGSTFEVRIPVAVPAETKFVPIEQFQKTFKGPSASEVINLKGLNILLVEDSPDNQLLVQKLLGKTGATITLANDGAQGMKLALASQFDVILMDIQMPIMDGHDAVRGLRSKGYVGPIVALTAHAMKEERERTLKSGFTHFLTKPINKKGLTDLLGFFHNPLHI